jgi:tape measure domain-containing protein
MPSKAILNRYLPVDNSTGIEGTDQAAFGIDSAKQAVAGARAIVDEFIQMEGKLRKVGAALASDKANDALEFGLNVGIGAVGAVPSAYDKSHPAIGLINTAASMLDTTGSVVTNGSDEAIAKHAVLLKKMYLDPLLRGEVTIQQVVAKIRGQQSEIDPLLAQLQSLEGNSLARVGDVGVELELYYKKLIELIGFDEQRYEAIPDEVTQAIKDSVFNENLGFGLSPEQKAKEAVQTGKDSINEANRVKNKTEKGLGVFSEVEQAINSGKTNMGWVDGAIGKFGGLKNSIIQTGASLLAAFGIYSAGDVLLRFNQQIFETSVKFERLANVIKENSGSSKQFATNLSFINAEISRLNIDKTQAFEQYGQLQGAVRGTALEGDASNRIFSAVAQAGTVQGLDPQAQQRTFLAITQMISKGKVSAEELRQQLGEALPSAFSTFAKALGVTTAQLNVMLERGQLGTEELLKFAAQLKSDSNSGVSGASELAQSKLNKLNNALTDLQLKAGETSLPLQKFGLDVGAYLVDGLAKGMGFIRVAFLAVSAGLVSYGFNLLLAIARTELFSKALAFLGVTSTKTFGAMALSVGVFIGKMALLGVAIEGIRQLWDASFDPETSALTKLVDQSVTDLDRLEGKIIDTQGKIADPSWAEQFNDTLVNGANSLTNNPDNRNLVTFTEKRKNDYAIAYSDAITTSDRFLNNQNAGVGFGSQAQKVAQDKIDRLTSQIQALKAKETSGEILASDRKGIEENIKAQKALTDERAKLQQKFADQNSFVSSQITLLNRFREGLIKTGATSDDFRVKNLDSVLSLLNKSAEATSNLMNRVANGLAEVNKNIRDLNESSSAFNENLDRQATAFKLQQANQNLGSNFGLPDFSLSGATSVDALRRAIIGQESGGNFRAVNKDSGALGYGQVMPENLDGTWGDWAKEAIGKSLTPTQFLDSPQLQLKILNNKLNQYFEQELKNSKGNVELAIRRVASKWYSGQAKLFDNPTPETYNGQSYPSIREYTLSILGKYRKEVGKGGLKPVQALGNLIPKSSETLASEQTLSDKKIAEARLKRSQEDYNKLSLQIQKSPNTLSNARAAGVFDENNIPNREKITRLLGDQNTDKDTKASLETLQKYIAAGDNLTKAAEDLASKELSYRQTRKDISFQADDAKRAAENEKANQSFANKIAEIGGSFDLQIEKTLDETQKKVLQSNKELAIAPLDQQLKLQQERQKLADLQIKKARYDQGGYPFGVDANSFGAQIANQNTLITSLEKQNKLALAKLKIQRQNLDIETQITIANERRTLSQQLALDIQKQTSDRSAKAFSRGLRDSLTEYNPELAASQQRFNEENNRITTERLTLTNEIKNAEIAIAELKRKGADSGIIADQEKLLANKKTGLADLDLDQSSNIRQKQIEDRLAIATGQIKALNNISTFTGLRGDIANIQADRLEKLGGDIFSANKIRLATEALKIQTELNVKVKEFDKLIEGTAQERSLAGFGSVEEVEAMQEATIKLAALKLDGLKEQFKDLGATIADNANSAFGEFFNNIFDGTKSISDAFKDMAVSILKSLAKIASEGFFSTLKNLLGLGGSDRAGFAQVLGGGNNGGGGGLLSGLGSLFGGGGGFSSFGLGSSGVGLGASSLNIGTGGLDLSGGGSFGFGTAIPSFLGFSSGGYTGDGNKFDPAGIVHKGEFVVSADRVRNAGAAYLDSLTANPSPRANLGAMDRGGNSRQQTSQNNTVVNQTFNMPSESNARETAAQVGAKQRQALDAIARRNFN